MFLPQFFAFLPYGDEPHKVVEREEVLPDLNEQPAHDKQLFLINDSQKPNQPR
jgi:hypothetical protein